MLLRATKTKFWVHDLDQRLWEFYTLDEDLDHRGGGQSLEEMVGADAAAKITKQQEPIVWEHRMFGNRSIKSAFAL